MSLYDPEYKNYEEWIKSLDLNPIFTREEIENKIGYQVEYEDWKDRIARLLNKPKVKKFGLLTKLIKSEVNNIFDCVVIMINGFEHVIMSAQITKIY
jgi:hypothetical protein